MKRSRKSTFWSTQKHKMSGLPSAIVVKFILKLPVKSIITCKCVCKTWHSLISDPEFAELHLAQAKTCALLRDTHRLKVSRSLFLVEEEDEDGGGYKSGYCSCNPHVDRVYVHDECERCRVVTKVKARLKVPLRNSQDMLERARNDDKNVIFCFTTSGKSKDRVKLKSCHDHRSEVLNSCNGLLCLCKNNLTWSEDAAHPVVVCNPITGEFMRVPNSGDDQATDGRSFALGFSPKHNQYKLVETFCRRRYNPVCHLHVVVAKVHTLGTDSWRSFDVSGLDLDLLYYPSYLDGALYWIFEDRYKKYRILCFDLNEEQFQVHSVPSFARRYGDLPRLALTALGGRLYVYTASAYRDVEIWVMNEYGNPKSWTKSFSIDVSEFQSSYILSPDPPLCFQLICCLNNEAVVMFGGPRREFIYYDKLGGLRFKQLKFRGLISELEAIAYTASFISLKDIVAPGSVEVLNINSGCGKLKLTEETYPLLLGGVRK